MNTLQTISLQNELLLSIANSLRSREVMHTFMQRARKLLDLDSIHFYHITEQAAQTQAAQPISHDIAVPHGDIRPHNHEVVYALLLSFCQPDADSSKNLSHDNKHYLAYRFPSCGVLLLVRETAFPQSLADILTPVLDKLAQHYQLCLQHRQLKRQVRDIEEVRRSYEQQARQDPLTQLPNRRQFRYALNQEISKARRYHCYGALLYIDLDNFKHVNDSLGHSVGDLLLTRIAEKLKTQARAGDDVYRLGGDEFVYILSNIGDNKTAATSTAQHVAARILRSMEEPIVIGEFSLHSTPSIGIALFPCEIEDECDSESILKHADNAMYRAKAQGRNRFEFFDPSMQEEANQRLIIEDHLRKAIHNNELHLAYQPIVDASQNIIGAESLVRWKNPDLGNVAPDNFVHIAEESNLILELSDWVVEHACEFASRLHKQLPANSHFRHISINISPRQFFQQDFVEQLMQRINVSKTPTHFLKLEFTENILAQNIDATIGKMNRLIDHGIEFMLDDFGTGYSSLSYLHRLPVRVLKIDKSFVSNITQQSKDQRIIVDAILALSNELGIECLVEGVETVDDYHYLKDRKLYGMQGYHFHKPMNAGQLCQILTDQNSVSASQ